MQVKKQNYLNAKITKLLVNSIIPNVFYKSSKLLHNHKQHPKIYTIVGTHGLYVR